MSNPHPYNEEYYEKTIGVDNIPYTRESKIWLSLFRRMAREITVKLAPKSSFEVGCAKGFLVESLRDLGVDAGGMDISEYAISQVREDVKPYCFAGNASEGIKAPRGRYDLVISIEVIEHLYEEEGIRAIENMTALSDCVLISSSSDDFDDPTHVNVRPHEYWEDIFRRFGFERDNAFYAGFISKDAFLFRKKRSAIKVNVVSDYSADSVLPSLRTLIPLRKLDKEVTVNVPVSFMSNRVLLHRQQFFQADLVVVQRGFCTKLNISEMKNPSRKVVFELDDLLFDMPPEHPSSWFTKEHGTRVMESIKEADAVTVSTEPLAEKVREINENVYVLPNYIDTEIWGEPVPLNDDEEGQVRVGYVGSFTHSYDLEIVVEPIMQLLEKYRGRLEFKFYGCLPEKLKGVDGVEYIEVGIANYRSFAEYMKRLPLDFAIAPLQNNPFNDCKSNLKYLEYSYCRIPGIYSRVAPYEDTIDDGRTGILSENSPESWISAMEKLIENKGLRKNLAQNAQKDVLEHYLLTEERAGQWLLAYSEIMKNDAVGLSLLEAKRGGASLVASKEGTGPISLHSGYDPQKEAARLVDDFDFEGKGLLIVLGVGLGYHVVGLAKRFPHADIVVVAFDPRMVELAGESGVMKDIPENVTLISGLPVEDVLALITKRQIGGVMAPVKIFPFSPEVSLYPEYYGRLAEKFERAESIKLWNRYGYKRFQETKSKVMFLSCNYFLEREIEEGLRKLGHSVLKVSHEKSQDVKKVMSTIMGKVLDFKPDFIFTINHLGFDNQGVISDFLESVEIPVASWFVDSPNQVLRFYDGNVSPNTALFVWDREYMAGMRNMGFDKVFYLPLGTDESLFKPMKLSKKKLKHYSCDVSFVGNSMMQRLKDDLERIPEEFRSIVEELATHMYREKLTVDEALEKFPGGEKEIIRNIRTNYRHILEILSFHMATMLYRTDCLKVMRDFKPLIRGDVHWNELLGKGWNTRPGLNYYREAPLQYNGAKINFNATSFQMPTSVNQRVFDVPACGSFLLTDYRSSMDELFVMGKEMVAYHGVEEIPRLVRYYLEHPGERKEISRLGRERVLKEHTYGHRLSEIIERMNREFA